MNVIKYLLIDEQTGKSEFSKEAEHHSIAVQKMLNSLDIRLEKIFDNISHIISNSMKEHPENRKVGTKYVSNVIKEYTEEVYLHYYTLSDFYTKVLKKIEEKKVSPIMKLKQIDSPLIKARKVQTGIHYYDHYDDKQIDTMIKEKLKELNRMIEELDLVTEIWNDFISLNEDIDVYELIPHLKNLNTKLIRITNQNISAAFFSFDDATKGLIKNEINVKVDFAETLNRMIDLILRSFIRCIFNYQESKEKLLIEKAFERLKQLKIASGEREQDLNLKVLIELKSLMDTEPKKINHETCYKKIGEMHASFHLKLFELKSFKNSKKLF